MNHSLVALVTGVSSGIGRATAEVLAEAGLNVYGGARRPEHAEPIKNVNFLPLDVRDDGSVRNCVASVMEQAGRIDVLVNNAGVTLFGAVEEISMEEAKGLFETNYFGVLRMTKAVLPQMRERRAGRIINVGSIAEFLPTPFEAAYGASKHAIEGFSESLSYEVAPFGMFVSIIQPGFVRTAMDRNYGTPNDPLAPFDGYRSRAITQANEATRKGANPTEAARVILSAIRSKRPKLRYLVGKDAFGTRLARSLAPSALFAMGVRSEYGIETPPA